MSIGILAGIYQHSPTGKRYTMVTTIANFETAKDHVVVLLDAQGRTWYVPAAEFTRQIKYPDYTVSVGGGDMHQDGGWGPLFVHEPERT